MRTPRMAVCWALPLVLSALLGASSSAQTAQADRPELLLQIGHGGQVSEIAYSPDGQLIASGAGDGCVRLWDPESGRVLRVLGSRGVSVTSVAFSPDGDALAAGYWEGLVRVWDLRTGQEPTAWPAGHSVTSLAFDPSGELLATAEEGGRVGIWDMRTGERRRSMGVPDDAGGDHPGFSCIAYSPDGQLLACGGRGNAVDVFDTGTGERVRSLEGHTGAVNCLAFSPADRLLVSGSEDGTVRHWDAVEGEEAGVTKIGDPIVSLSYSRDGQVFAVGPRLKRPLVWSAGAGVWVRPAPVTITECVALSPDGNRLATSALDGVVRVEDWRRHYHRSAGPASSTGPTTRLMAVYSPSRTGGARRRSGMRAAGGGSGLWKP